MKMFDILVVEDDKELRHLFCTILRKNGYTCLEAENANIALDILQNRYIDLIISDLILPDGDGYTLYESLKKINSQVPFIITSGYSKEKEELKKLISEGINFLRKPFSSEDLLNAVFTTLKKDESKSTN
jgi:DNA-binding NtrC family response regulator